MIEKIARRFASKLYAMYLKRKNSKGAKYIDKSTQFLGWRNICIGINSVISEQCWFNVNHRQGNEIQISIGRNAFIGRRNFFSSGDLIVVGDFCLTGIDCRFMGANHIYSDPNKPYAFTGTTSGGQLIVGANCWLGAGVNIVGSLTIGHGSVIGAGSVVNKSIPPFSVAVGNPCVVVRRFDPLSSKWIKATDFTPEMEKELPDESTYIELLNSNYSNPQMPVAAASRNFGDMH